MSVSPMKQPSALLPLAMTLVALAMVLGHAAVFGVVHEPDEGTAAHVFQLLVGHSLEVDAQQQRVGPE